MTSNSPSKWPKDYKDKVESTFDSRRLWNGLRCIPDYKKENAGNVCPAASLADELNNFYARFDTDNKEQVLYLQVASEAETLILKREDVKWSFKKVNPQSSGTSRHPRLGPQSVR